MSSNKKIERNHPGLCKDEQACLLEHFKIVPYAFELTKTNTGIQDARHY